MKEVEHDETPDVSGGQVPANANSPIMITYPILPVLVPPEGTQPVDNRILTVPLEPLP